MAMLDDVACYALLYDSLERSVGSVVDAVLWVMVAHMLVRPRLIEHLRNEVCSKNIRPTRAGISRVMDVLARRHGQVASRMPAGKRTWRQVDVFGVASTQTRGGGYCGSRKMHEQLEQYEELNSVAEKVAAYRGKKALFTDLVNAIGRAGLVCYSEKGYWTVHLARVFVPDFGGIKLVEGVKYSPECARTLYNMGEGGRSLEQLGITEWSFFTRGGALCKCIEAMSKRLGVNVCMQLPHLVCAACEAHRRYVFGGGAIMRRAGL